MNRRKAILAIAAGVSCTASHTADASSWTPPSAGSLDNTAQNCGLYFGCAVRMDQLRADTALRDLILRQCSRLTPELTLKWAAIEPTWGELDFKDMDELSSFAVSHGKIIRGHTLLWHKSVPTWAPQWLGNPSEGWKSISRYFGSVMPRFGDVIQHWDVVNEPIELSDGRPDGLRMSPFLAAFGPEYIGRALTEARKFAPKAKLMINEYGLEYDFAEDRKRRWALLALLEGLKKRNVPLDGLGLQSHLDLCKGRVATTAIRAFIKEVMDLGLFIEVTELDVKECAYTASAHDRDILVGDEVRRYLDVVLEAERIAGVTTWGITDLHSWLVVGPEDFARFPNAWRDGATPGLNRGLPFDAALAPKPMYDAIAKAIAARHDCRHLALGSERVLKS